MKLLRRKLQINSQRPWNPAIKDIFSDVNKILFLSQAFSLLIKFKVALDKERYIESKVCYCYGLHNNSD